jgi:hypothetical protein
VEEVTEYHKISGPFKRHTSGPDKNKLMPWVWAMPEFEVLANIPWTFTEKIDGTNIRIIWDGHKPVYRGRTDRAEMHPDLLKALEEMFPEELLEQTFGANSAILYGEGYGAGIQKGGGNYRKDKSFILFDVNVGGWWLMRDSVVEIAGALGIDVVPVIMQLSLSTAIKSIAAAELYSVTASMVSDNHNFVAEGVVGTPAVPLFNRKGERIIVKLKGCDLYGLALD